MKNKVFKLLLVLVVVLSLVACSGGNSGLTKTEYSGSIFGVEMEQTFYSKGDEIHKVVMFMSSEIGEGKPFATKEEAESANDMFGADFKGMKGVKVDKKVDEKKVSVTVEIDLDQLSEAELKEFTKTMKVGENSKYPSLKEAEKSASEIGLKKK